MTDKYFEILALSSIFFISCGSPKNTVINANVLPIEINYNENNNYIVIENISVNNSPIDGSLIFDTGSEGTVIDNSIVKELNLITFKKVALTDITGKTTRVPCVKIDSMNISGAVFKDIYVLVTDLSLFNCENVKIIIGNNVLKTGIWEIDLVHKKIILNNPKEKFDYSGYYKIPFSYRMNLINLHITHAGEKIRNILFDTGNPNGLILSLKDKESNSKLEPDYRYETYYRSLNDMQPEKTITDNYFLSNIKLNDELRVDSVLTSYKRKRLIGLGFFKGNTMVIDYKSQIIGLKRPFNLHKQKSKKIGIAFNTYNRNEVIISALRKNSPADKIGIQVGDKVQIVNNIAISEFQLNECELIDSLNSMTNDTLYLKLEKWNDSKKIIPDK